MRPDVINLIDAPPPPITSPSLSSHSESSEPPSPVTIRALIAQLQFFDPDLTLEWLLGQEDYTTALRTMLKTLSPHAQMAARKITLEDRHNRALRAVRKLPNIVLPEAVTSQYKACLGDPARFWEAEGLRLEADDPLEYLTRIYFTTQRVEFRQDEWGILMWRHLAMFFHDIWALLNGQSKVRRQLVVRGQLLGLKIEKDDLSKWRSAGLRYGQLVGSLGSGALFFLPLTVTNKTWEQELPSSGDTFNEVVENLESRDLRTEEIKRETNALGRGIREALLQPLYDFDFLPRPDSPSPARKRSPAAVPRSPAAAPRPPRSAPHPQRGAPRSPRGAPRPPKAAPRPPRRKRGRVEMESSG